MVLTSGSSDSLEMGQKSRFDSARTVRCTNSHLRLGFEASHHINEALWVLYQTLCLGTPNSTIKSFKTSSSEEEDS